MGMEATGSHVEPEGRYRPLGLATEEAKWEGHSSPGGQGQSGNIGSTDLNRTKMNTYRNKASVVSTPSVSAFRRLG